MSPVSGERRTISELAGWIFMVILGAFLLYFGTMLIGASVALVRSDGPVALAVALGAIGVALVVLPFVILMSQVRAMLRRRRGGRPAS